MARTREQRETARFVMRDVRKGMRERVFEPHVTLYGRAFSLVAGLVETPSMYPFFQSIYVHTSQFMFKEGHVLYEPRSSSRR